jgi:glycosyltransferase involved in cell wall biosynthesis
MTSVAMHVDQLFYRIPGGIGTYVRRLLPALRTSQPSVDLSVFHARFGGRLPSELEGLRRTEIARGIRTLYPLWNWTGRPSLPDPLGRADVIHAPSPVAIPPVSARQRLVVTVHDLAFRRYPKAYPATWRYLHAAGFARALRTADAVIAVSQSTASDLASVGRLDPNRIHIVPLGGSLEVGTADVTPVLERLRIPRPYALFVGTFEPRKNVVRLIRAYRRIAAKVPHALILAGPAGWGSTSIRRELALHGAGRVEVTGHLPEADLDALYRGADAFVYPSLYEGFGLPVLDAMARGVPVLTSNTSSLPELTGGAAVHVAPTYTLEMADALEHLLTDESDRSRLAEAGRTRARHYTWERAAASTLEVYEKVAS